VFEFVSAPLLPPHTHRPHAQSRPALAAKASLEAQSKGGGGCALERMRLAPLILNATAACYTGATFLPQKTNTKNKHDLVTLPLVVSHRLIQTYILPSFAFPDTHLVFGWAVCAALRALRAVHPPQCQCTAAPTFADSLLLGCGSGRVVAPAVEMLRSTGSAGGASSSFCSQVRYFLRAGRHKGRSRDVSRQLALAYTFG